MPLGHSRTPSFSSAPSYPSERRQSLITATSMILDDFGLGNSQSLQLAMSEQPKMRPSIAQALLRCVKAGQVATPFSEMDRFRERSSDFWSYDSRGREFYDWSAPRVGGQQHYFLSHSWSPPENWNELMPGVPYEEMKGAEICLVMKDIAAATCGDSSRWSEVLLWIDKCCIYQEDDDLLGASISLIEEFLHLCDGLVVLFTWSYLSRLWCVYEWACFLLIKDPMQLHVCADTLCRSWTEELLVSSVRGFRLQNCQCVDPLDRQIIKDKIGEFYESEEAFERFLKFTVIALLARCLVVRGSRNKAILTAWAEVADECGFGSLARELAAAHEEDWSEVAVRQSHGQSPNGGSTDADGVDHCQVQLSTSCDLQETKVALCDAWFCGKIVPLIDQERELAIRAGSGGPKSAGGKSGEAQVRYAKQTSTISI